MSGFFKSIVDYNLFHDWAATLDWLVDDDKFSPSLGWSSGYVGSLTKKIQKLPKFSIDKTYFYGSPKNLKFPGRRCKSIMVIFSKGESEAKDMIRHIRNGIAHGKTKCFKSNGELFIEIKDYKDSSKKQQTAYICFPISYVVEIQKLYNTVQNSINSSKTKKIYKEK